MSVMGIILVWGLIHSFLSHDQGVVSATIADKLPSAILSSDETEVVTFNVDANGNETTLQLNCSGEGALTWYRREPPNAYDLSQFTTLLEGNLLMLTISPVVNNTDASNDGIPYYCVANNTLGQARSRTVLIKYAFFGGFKAENTTTMVDVRLTQAVAIECGVVAAAPPPTYIWFKDNMTIDTTADTNKIRTLDGGATLVIYQLTNDDISPDYNCGVTNARMFDTEISTRKFRLFEDATFLTDNTNFFVYRGPKSVTVTTTALSNGITFYYIGATAAELPSVTGIFASTGFTEDDATLSASTSSEPALTPQLTLGNGNDQITPSRIFFNITVIEPLVVIDRPSNISTIYHCFTNESINFTCTATGTGTRLQWFRNTERIDLVGSTLIFDKISISDAGVYQCFWEESDDGTFALDTWALTVQEPVPPNSFVFTSSAQPSVLNPNRTIVAANDTVSLTLEFRADDIVSITWFRNETETGVITEIDFTDPLYYTTGANRTDNEDWFRVIFTIVRINIVTSGFYYAVIDDGQTPPINSPIWFVSDKVPLQVVSLTLSPHNCLLDGADNQIQCIVRGLPDPEVTFEKNAGEVSCPVNGSCTLTSDLEGLVTDAVLGFNSVSADDNGVYACQASNARTVPLIEERLFSGQLVQFCTSPNITAHSNVNQRVNEGDDIILMCQVDTVPILAVAVTWYKDSVELQDIPNQVKISAIYLNGLSEVTLRNVSDKDSALYTCSFNNTLIPQEVSLTINLTVTMATSTTEVPTTTPLPVWIPVTAIVGGGLALFLLVTAILVIVVVWYWKMMKTITKSSTSTVAVASSGNRVTVDNNNSYGMRDTQFTRELQQTTGNEVSQTTTTAVARSSDVIVHNSAYGMRDTWLIRDQQVIYEPPIVAEQEVIYEQL